MISSLGFYFCENFEQTEKFGPGPSKPSGLILLLATPYVAAAAREPLRNDEKTTKKRTRIRRWKKIKLRKWRGMRRCQVARETRAQISLFPRTSFFFNEKMRRPFPTSQKNIAKRNNCFCFSHDSVAKKNLGNEEPNRLFPIFPIFGNQITGCRYEKWFTELKNGDTQTS